MFGIHRNLASTLLRDLARKFVFLSGPRQVGKTTLAKKIIHSKQGYYYLYDDEEDRTKILNKDYIHHSWVCLDEFHKFHRWKAHLKGVFDKYHESLHLLLTGSARLDIFQKSGDSLLGRYYLHHLHPLSCGELDQQAIPPLPSEIHGEHKKSPALEPLLKFGGFPEPFHLQSEKEHRRWSLARRQLLIREDLRELTQVQLISLVEQLMLLLPQKIGSIFSYTSLSEDIRVSVPTIQNWMQIFEKLFIVFKVPPYSKNITRAIQKQPKYFFCDWSQIKNEGARFENFVASHLWKAVQIWTDLGEAELGLYFIRDRDRREVDFLLTREGNPWFLVEVKLSETSISENLDLFCHRLQIPGIQLLLKDGVHQKKGNITIISANRWLGLLP